MEKIQKTLERYPDRVSKSDFLELAKKDEKGVPRPTGPHKVKLLRGEFAKRDTEFHQNEQGIMLYFEENGKEVKYFVPLLNKEGKFHYLFERFGEIEEGAELEIEFVKKGLKGFIDVRTAEEGKEVIQTDASDKDIPVVEDENNSGEIE